MVVNATESKKNTEVTAVTDSAIEVVEVKKNDTNLDTQDKIIKVERDLSHLDIKMSDEILYRNTQSTLEQPKDMQYSFRIGKKEYMLYALRTEKVPFTMTVRFNQTVKVKGVNTSQALDICSITATNEHIITKILSKLALTEAQTKNLPYLGNTTLSTYADIALYEAIPFWVKNAEKIVRQDNQPPYWYIISLLWYQIKQDVGLHSSLSESMKASPFTLEEYYYCLYKTATKFPDHSGVLQEISRIPKEYDYLIDYVKSQDVSARNLQKLKEDQIKAQEALAETSSDIEFKARTIAEQVAEMRAKEEANSSAYRLEEWKISLLDHYIDFTDMYGSKEDGNALLMNVGITEQQNFEAFLQLIKWSKDNHDLAYEAGIISAFLENGFYVDGLDKSTLEKIIADNSIYAVENDNADITNTVDSEETEPDLFETPNPITEVNDPDQDQELDNIEPKEVPPKPDTRNRKKTNITPSQN